MSCCTLIQHLCQVKKNHPSSSVRWSFKKNKRPLITKIKNPILASDSASFQKEVKSMSKVLLEPNAHSHSAPKPPLMF